MKPHYGNYLGIVVNNKDPETRGRVQVFIPHIMPALYESWNEAGEDITITCVGDNIKNALTSNIIDKLTQILPWSEAASPIIGNSAPGNLTPGGGSAGGAAGGAAGAVSGGPAGRVYNQEPTGTAATIQGELGPIYNEAKNYAGGGDLGSRVLAGYNGGGYKGACGRGTIAALGAMTGNAAFKQGNAGGDARDYSLGRSAPSDHIANSGLYQPRTAVPADYTPQVGDVIACDGGTGFGHIQTYTGVGSKPWTSDTPQEKPLFNGYYNCALHRATPAGLQTIKAKLDTLYGAGASSALGEVDKQTAESANPAAVPPTTSPDGQVPTTAPTPQTGTTPQVAGSPTPTQTGGLVAGPPGTGTPAGTVSGKGTSTTGNAKLASDRQARFAQELNDPAILARLQALAVGTSNRGPEVGSNPAAIQAFTETVVNRAYFSNRSLKTVLYESGYGFKGTETATPSPAVKEAFSKVMNGSNMTNLATDAGFNLPNSGRGKNGLFITGMQSKDYVIQGVIDLKTGNQVTDPALLNKLYTEGDKTGNYEFFVRQSRGTSAAGIEAYAQQNGISSDGFTTDLNANLSSAGGIPTTASGAPSVVNNTDPGGPTTVINTNDSAKGLFAYPNPGAMVWVFFREGNPLYPVYFAASYSASEWSSAYRGASESDGYANTESLISTATHFNPNRAGGLTFNVTTDLTDPSGLQDKASVVLYGDDGSNMMLAKGQHQIYTRHNRRDQVDRDRFETTMGFKEQWIEGDYSINVRGNYILKIGKIDQESMDALQKLADYSSQINSQLTNSGGGGGGGGGGSTKALEDSTLPANLQKAIDDRSILNKLAPEGTLDVNKDLGSQVPAYLRANATEAEKAKFFADAKAIQDSRKGFIGENYTSQQGTMTPGSQLPRSTTATKADFASVNASKQSATTFTPVGNYSWTPTSNPTPQTIPGTPSRAAAIASAPKASTGTGTQVGDIDQNAAARAAANRAARNAIVNPNQ